ncbi:hypothetical protein ATE84_2434 [Aquimarina sp. MAR_2010_214]|uniref:hypothetical protein n=1 Tax=Aquimarina sp. MAR_2010_214 TaxID=1250026 RepID=UPI000CC398D6|nr:hypothetical protein [Aquimarina sp. MAR_2010_214]PKV50377.1 hypothetical protein ATE84_2434 [Aquimarina sp. MAR_2010_214]
MKHSCIKYNVVYIFLILFLSMKIGDFHMLFHTCDKDKIVHCTICEHAIIHDLTPFITPDTQGFTFENTEFVVQREMVKHYDFFSCGTIRPDQLFSRPPPSLL